METLGNSVQTKAIMLKGEMVDGAMGCVCVLVAGGVRMELHTAGPSLLK